MKITPSLLDSLCELSRLELDTEEREALLKDLQRIVDFVEKINELPLEGIEPMRFVGRPAGYLREDEPQEPDHSPLLFQNAPKADGLYIRVPKFGVKE
ncbi:MAG: Asp-tRNA(Asn)/Glu-tRNA(Gln) amidotransferase subunit GatC [Bacteroidia bacterium]|nr:Asp-tRNA(Asn)/Glu-tRNA(Gln) amidotransferase subunit GatC [Bacteroidia bacterium]MCX7763976.1 Asp-tRNA(Asn)/Glu-tRNA(Gln) amidotransferase subunit GatC [Bacteroidia bacterium]MDW8058240.1 Asp-tRNA(Asn)/Glu-tRNA(Gln) amidotransferase subunit GatC [Bacteroidia bacterium]